MWPHHSAVLTIVLTRHGHTDHSTPDQYTGQSVEAHLTDIGRAGALALGARLAGVEFARVIASPLDRAVETARLIRPVGPMETDDRLMEADYGAWEGHLIDEIADGWPAEREAWEADPASVTIPGGESGSDVARRASAFLDELIAWETGIGEVDVDHRVLLVGHATLNRVLLAVALGIPLKDYRRRLEQSWVNLTVLRYDADSWQGARLLVYNDVAHVSGLVGQTWD